MALYGITTTAHTGLPDNVDLAKLNVYTTRDGVGYGQALTFARSAARSFGAFDWPQNPEVASLLEYLVYPDADDQLSWRIGDLTASRIPVDAQGQVVRQRRQRAGSQVPEVRALVPLPAYTWDTTRPGRGAISSTEVESDIVQAAEALQNDVYSELLRAVIYKAARAVEGSTTGKAVGWVGATDQDYVPNRRKGTSYSGHSHYLTDAAYADTADGRRALFAAMADTVTEHNRRHSSAAPFLILHGSASRSDVELDAQYGAPTVAGVAPGSTVTQVTDVPDWAHGKDKRSGAWFVDVGTVLAEHYYVLVKSYGRLNPLNPVRLTYPADLGFGPTLFDGRTNYPVDANTPVDAGLLQNLDMVLLYGLGVQQPESGAAGLIGGAGVWTDPTIA